MQIPGGDLAPARRRRYGGGYGRRRRMRHVRLIAAVLVVAALGVAGVVWDRNREPDAAPREVVSSCPSASATTAPVTLPSPSQVRLVLLNGTSRNGLAKAVGQALTARGFVVTEAATAPAALPGPSRVVWGPGGEPAALVLAQHVPGAQVVADSRAAAGSVQVTLGSDFQRLADPVAPTASPTPGPSACVSMHQ